MAVASSKSLRYSTLIESSPAVMLVTTGSDGTIQFANAVIGRVFGYPPGELVGQSIDVLVPARLRKGHADLRRRFAASPSSRPMGAGRELVAVRRDGTEFPVEIGLTPIQSRAGLLVLATIIDITKRKRAELTLTQRTAELDEAVRGAVDGIITIDETGAMQSANPAAAKLFGYDTVELVGKNVSMLMPEPYRSEHDHYLRRYLRTGKAKIIGIGREVEGRRKDGSIFPMDLGVSVVAVDGKKVFVGFIHDLSERRRVEARLQKLHADRLNAIGGMASALAHEVNQPLSASTIYLRAAQRLLDRPPELRTANLKDVLEAAIEQILRAGRIVSNLQEFVARGEPNKTVQSLHELIRDVCELMIGKAKEESVRVDLRLSAEDDCVLVDRVQIKQVLVNLMRNALEAMKGCDRRELIVSTTSVENGMTRIDVADTGLGVPKEIEANLFEPFSGTKGEGLGIGLSISRSIIEAHYGRIWVNPSPEGGTVFSFTLPAHDPRETQ
jgi:two-component system sensor kinase FixL